LATPGGSAPSVINWEAGLFSAAAGAAPKAKESGWMSDFANYLGKTKAEREPNAKIRIAATPAVTPAATPELSKYRAVR
jgi:hypothetical protein